MNYMPEIAEMLGVKLGKEFYITNSDDVFKITMDGFMVKACNGVWRKYITAFYHLMIGDEEVIKLPKQSEKILTDKERNDLYGVIRTFRKKVIGILKYYFRDVDSGFEYISIIYYIDDKYRKEIELPPFPEDSAYKGMHNGVFYSLEELEL